MIPLGFLNAAFLAAAAFAAVPLLLHLLHRQQPRSIAFPALRYLQRTERDHARRIRARQLRLLALRLAAVVLLVLAGAGLHLAGGGASHPPTALAIVLDNSASSGAVVGGERVLDQLRRQALRTVAMATDADRIWVIRAGEPWASVTPVGPADAARRIQEALPTSAGARLPETLSRARQLLASSTLEHREIHLLSDLQATAFAGPSPTPVADVPVVVWTPPAPHPGNRALGAVAVSGGAPPLVGEAGFLTVRLEAAPEGGDDEVEVRMVVDGRVRSAARGPRGSFVSLPLPPAEDGWMVGRVETDPDALAADDARYFAFRSGRAARVATAADPGPYLDEALGVLASGGRVERVAVDDADLVVAPSAEGLDRAGPGAALVLLPPRDAGGLPALNRRLRQAGIPWELAPTLSRGEVALEGRDLPPGLEGARASFRFRILPTGGAAGSPPLASAAGEPWLVEGVDGHGRRYALLGSPLVPEATSLPFSAAMIRLTDWLASVWRQGPAAGVEATAGEPLPAPRGAAAVRTPSGAQLPLDGTRTVWETGEAGHYAFLDGDTVVAWAAVGTPSWESDLAPLSPDLLEEHVGPDARTAATPEAWDRAVFASGRRNDLTTLLLLGALGLLVGEAAAAASGQGPGARRTTHRHTGDP